MASESKNTKHIDYLTEDPPIHGQEWICVSFLSPEGIKNCKIRGLKFRGAFPTEEDARKHAKEIQEKLDPDFHVFVGEGFKWLPWDQDPETVEDQEYHEKELNELMKAAKEQLLFKKQHENERRTKMIEENMPHPSHSGQKYREKLQKKHMLRKQKEIDSTEPKKKEIVETKDESGNEPLSVGETKEELQKKLMELSETDKKIAEEKDKIGKIKNEMKKMKDELKNVADQ